MDTPFGNPSHSSRPDTSFPESPPFLDAEHSPQKSIPTTPKGSQIPPIQDPRLSPLLIPPSSTPNPFPNGSLVFWDQTPYPLDPHSIPSPLRPTLLSHLRTMTLLSEQPLLPQTPLFSSLTVYLKSLPSEIHPYSYPGTLVFPSPLLKIS